MLRTLNSNPKTTVVTAKAARGRRLNFVKAEESSNIEHIGPLRERVIRPDGVAVIDLSILDCAPVLAQFVMKGAINICNTTPLSKRTTISLAHNLKSAFGHLIEEGFVGGTGVVLPSDITSAWLFAVEKSIRSKWPEATGRRYFRAIRHALREADAIHASGVLPGQSSAVIAGKWSSEISPVRTKHREPYSDGEMARIEAACYADVKDIIKRLKTDADRLRQEGRDPREVISGWKSLANCVWFVENVLNGQNMRHPEISKMLGKWSHYTNSWVSYQGFETRLVYSSIYPTSSDMVPFFVLVAAKTGMNVESLQALKRSDIRPGHSPDEVIVHYRKMRAKGNENQNLTLSSRGWRSAGGLLKIYLHLTERLSRASSYDDVWLSVDPGKSWGLIKNIGWVKMIHAFSRRHGLKDDAGNDLTLIAARLRPTQKTRDYRVNGNLSNAGGDHRHDDTTADYVENRVTRNVHDQTVTDALHDFHTYFQNRIIPDTLSRAEALSLIGGEPRTAQAIFEGKQDVFVASCRDFYNRPGGRTNSPCDRPWHCFSCSNAVWLSRNLQMLIQFLDFIEGQRTRLVDQDWQVKFGLPYQAITRHILPAFSSSVIEAARIAARDQPVYIPTEMRGE